MVGKLTNFKVDIVDLFRSNYQERFHIRYMAQLLGTSHVTLLPHLKELEDDKILVVKQVGRNKEFMLNHNNILTKDMIIISEKNKLIDYLSKNNKFIDFYDLLSKETLMSTVILVEEKGINKLVCVGKENLKELDIIKKLLKSSQLDISVELISVENFAGKNLPKDRILLNNSDLFVNIMWRIYCESK